MYLQDHFQLKVSDALLKAGNEFVPNYSKFFPLRVVFFEMGFIYWKEKETQVKFYS